MAQPPRVAEALARFLSRAGISALAASSSATRRAVARAAACSSAAGPSSDYSAVSVCSSDAVLAALRVTNASAARRALFHASASSSKGAAPHVLLLPAPRASEPAPLLATDTAAGATDPSTSSSTTSLWYCLAGGSGTSELVVLAAVRPNPNLAAAASRIGSGISYPLGFPVTGQGIWPSFAVFLLPEASSPPLPPSMSISKAFDSQVRQGYRRHGFNRASQSSNAHYGTSSRPDELFTLPPPLQSVDNLILLMNGMTFDEEDKMKFKQAFHGKFETLKNVDELISLMNEMTFDEEAKVKFKQAFYEKFRTLKTALGIAEFLHYQKYGYAEWLCILKVITQKTGPHKETMDLQIKEDLRYSEELEEEFTNDPTKAMTQVKLDMILKGQEELRGDSKKIIGFCDPQNKTVEWGTFVFFGRKFDTSKILGLIKLLGF